MFRGMFHGMDGYLPGQVVHTGLSDSGYVHTQKARGLSIPVGEMPCIARQGCLLPPSPPSSIPRLFCLTCLAFGDRLASLEPAGFRSGTDKARDETNAKADERSSPAHSTSSLLYSPALDPLPVRIRRQPILEQVACTQLHALFLRLQGSEGWNTQRLSEVRKKASWRGGGGLRCDRRTTRRRRALTRLVQQTTNQLRPQKRVEKRREEHPLISGDVWHK